MTFQQFKDWLITLINSAPNPETPPPAIPPTPLPTPTNKIYLVAKSCLGKHITLDSTVPPDLGCAEAVSYVIKNAGIPFPTKGIPGTAALYTWLTQNATKVTAPKAGDVIISPTGQSSKGSPHGHVGIVALYGVLSNDSDSGLFAEKYTLDTWHNYFGITEGFPVYYYRIIN